MERRQFLGAGIGLAAAAIVNSAAAQPTGRERPTTGEGNMETSAVENLYFHEINVLHTAEREIAARWPRFVRGAKSTRVRAALSDQALRSVENEKRLREIIQRLEAGAAGASCIGIFVLLDEMDRALVAGLEPEMVDVQLVLGAERVRQYQASGYRAVEAYAKRLGHERDAQRFQQELKAATSADSTLTVAALVQTGG